MYFSDFYKDKDSIELIAAEIIISLRQINFSLLQKSCYNTTKVDTTFICRKHKKAKRSFVGKYLIFEETYSDTIFNLNKGDKLKFYDGNYYLNRITEKNDWEIYQFKKNADNSYSINLTNEQDDQALKEKTKEQTIFHRIKHLSNKDFKTFVKNGGFREKYTLKKYAP